MKCTDDLWLIADMILWQDFTGDWVNTIHQLL